jgi:hypothetical protein
MGSVGEEPHAVAGVTEGSDGKTSQKPEARNQRPEARDQKPEDQKPEARSQKKGQKQRPGRTLIFLLASGFQLPASPFLLASGFWLLACLLSWLTNCIPATPETYRKEVLHALEMVEQRRADVRAHQGEQ